MAKRKIKQPRKVIKKQLKVRDMLTINGRKKMVTKINKKGGVTIAFVENYKYPNSYNLNKGKIAGMMLAIEICNDHISCIPIDGKDPVLISYIESIKKNLQNVANMCGSDLEISRWMLEKQMEWRSN
jgi:hypothetical protein